MNSVAELETDIVKVNDDQSKGKKAVLPPIRKGHSAKVDHIPSNLLITLTQNGQHFEDLGPGKKKFNQKRPDNVWNHKKQRLKFKHLLEQPACFCGAGRDISYLVDATGNKNNEQSSEKHKHSNTKEESITDCNKNCIPETIIPSEFHVVKHQGVAALNIDEDAYKTKPEDHEKHMTVFPSLRPAGRQEAVQLLQTMNDLLKKAGVRDLDEDESHIDMDLQKENDSGKQIDELLSLVKEEQKIYNIIFHEIIRQVSVECVERGSVLAELRNRYAKILDRVPRQVHSLHEEVIAQKALDRRLTEELTRFKSSIALLTKELYEIHCHDEEVTRQAELTQVELSDALRESEKNASLLAEYHDLYEMQRRRLDYQLSKLIEERDLWAGSAHMLSLKVAKRHNLVSVQRLHLYEKSWHKLSMKFATLLSDTDDEYLQVSSKAVRNWQDVALSFHQKLCASEKQTALKIQSILDELMGWSLKFENVVTTDDGIVRPLDIKDINELHEVLKTWERAINEEIERFTGDTLLRCEDDLLQLNTCVDTMITSIQKVFRNHPNEKETCHPQQTAMHELRKTITRLHNTFQLRMCGENGLSRNFIFLINTLDTWVSKLNILLNGGETMFDSEWIQLTDFIQQQWKESLQSSLRILSLTDERQKCAPISPKQTSSQESWASMIVEVDDVVKATQDWLENVVNVFQRDDSTIIEQINSTHSNMVKWMVTVLICIVPDMKDENMIDVDKTASSDNIKGLGEAILAESQPSVIFDRATILFNWLRSLTDLVSICCKNVIIADIQDVNTEDTKSNDEELKDLKRLEIECQGWMKTANFLLSDIIGKTIPLDDFISAKLKLTEQENTIDERVDTPSESVLSSTFHDEARNTPLTNPRSTPQAVTDESMNFTMDTHRNDVSDIFVIGPNEPDNQAVSNIKSDAFENDKYENEVSRHVEDRIQKETSEKTIKEIEMHIIGPDENVKKTVVSPPPQKDESDRRAEDRLDVKLSSMSMEGISLLENLQTQLLESEERAQKAEKQAYEAEKNLKEAKEQIRALERSLSRATEASKMESDTALGSKKSETEKQVNNHTEDKTNLLNQTGNYTTQNESNKSFEEKRPDDKVDENPPSV